MVERPRKIILIGAGNVATHLGLALVAAGHEVVQVYSHTMDAASQLSKKIGAKPVNNINKLGQADIYIIALKDDAVETICKKLKTTALVLHTSGSLGMDILKKTSKNIGVFYPLQTFSKTSRLDFRTIPLCIEASGKIAEKELVSLAKSISSNVHLISSEKREILHLAAVFACNFSNHMYALASKILSKHRLPFELLIPLIEETASKIKKAQPQQMQTGPALRGDKKVMQKQLKMLKDNKDLQALYTLISKSIIKNKK